MPDHLALDHLALDDLADLAVGELPVDASTAAKAHLARCGSCRAELAQVSADLDSLSGQLAPLRTSPMPVAEAARLDRVLADKWRRCCRSGRRHR